jgi:uncharacterized membrane protein
MGAMTTPGFASAGGPIFAASLTPHRALSRRGVRIVIALVAILASIPIIVFFALGAWPVVGFMGLDVLAVWWALSASMKDGKRLEQVTLYPDNLVVRQVSPAGADSRSIFNPFFVRLVVTREAEGRVTGLALRSRDDELPIGSVLNPADKATFAKAFGAALSRARG